MLDALEKRHPYIAAKTKFLRGDITTLQAIAMVAKDREFIAECDLSGRDVLESARAIVMAQWCRALVAHIQFAKQLRGAGHAA